MRAVTQNRAHGGSMGIRTGRVDALTFGLGSGIAGLAGVALSQIDNVSPNLGQSYIIDSFLVVVFGGVGNLWGTLVGALSLGIANKFLEPYAGAVLGKIAAARLHHPVHPEAPARPVRAQGPGGGSMITRRSLGGAATGRGWVFLGILAAAAILVPLPQPAGAGRPRRSTCRPHRWRCWASICATRCSRSRSTSSGATAASSRSATAPSSRSAATPWACT